MHRDSWLLHNRHAHRPVRADVPAAQRRSKHTSSSTWCASPESISVEWSGAQWALWAVGGHATNEESRKQHTRQSSSWTLFNMDLFKQTLALLLSAHGSHLWGHQPCEKSHLSQLLRIKVFANRSCLDNQHCDFRKSKIPAYLVFLIFDFVWWESLSAQKLPEHVVPFLKYCVLSLFKFCHLCSGNRETFWDRIPAVHFSASEV